MVAKTGKMDQLDDQVNGVVAKTGKMDQPDDQVNGVVAKPAKMDQSNDQVNDVVAKTPKTDQPNDQPTKKNATAHLWTKNPNKIKAAPSRTASINNPIDNC